MVGAVSFRRGMLVGIGLPNDSLEPTWLGWGWISA